MRNNPQTPITLLRCKAVLEVTGLKRSALYKSMSKGDFPQSIKITAKAVAWSSIEVEAWILSRITISKQTKLPHQAFMLNSGSTGGEM